jgi:photosystem II stability/assembly factor-like uncharacterized protein
MDFYKASEASLWVQPDGANTVPRYLGCHELGDLDMPKGGDLKVFYCPDEGQSGGFKVTGSYQGTPGIPGTSLTTKVGATADWLETINCPFNLYIFKQHCGRRDSFNNWDRAWVYRGSVLTGHKASGMAVSTPDSEVESTQSFDLSALEAFKMYQLLADRVGVGSTGDFRAIHFCGQVMCAGVCGPAQKAGKYGWASGEVPTGSAGGKGELYYTNDYGVTWTPSPTDPFGPSEIISAITCFDVSATVTRIVVARGTTDAGNPAEIAYSDDGGTTWAKVNVGSVNAQFVSESGGLFALDQFHMWLVTNTGYIYFSADGGLTWVTQDAGVLTASPLLEIKFLDTEHGWVVGNSNEIDYTVNGGSNWSPITGPGAMAAAHIDALAVIDTYRIWIGYSTGALYYTADGGLTWTARNTGFSDAADILRIEFYNELVGYILYNTAGPVGKLLQTVDGGYTWRAITLATNSGLRDLALLDANTLWLAGDLNSGTAVLEKVFAA